MKKQLEENIDYYYNEQGYVVLTEKYHRERGYCCGNGCLHCPFDYENVAEDKKNQLLAARKAQKGA
ncbi:DUF5522 domain-containing protein [Chitinophaga sp. 22620]|uniref:DUF5522 domain-containing protein n=1 Tax=Chitinophaga sp. 22620 TaxID=3453952 RepID=UPI003F85A72E